MDARTNLLLETLDSAGVSANVYRTAMRLWRATASGSHYVRLTYAGMCQLCDTTSDNTVRGHLSTLAATGLLIYQRNHSIHVWWKFDPALTESEPAVITTHTPCAPHDHRDHHTITEPAVVLTTRAQRAPYDHDDEDGDEPCAPHDQIAHHTRAVRTTRSQRAPHHHPTYTVGNTGKVGRQDLSPTYLPTGGDGGSGLTPDQNRAIALLTDPDFGMDVEAATLLARKYPFKQIRAHTFAVLRDLAAGKIRNVYVLGSRLRRGGFPKTTEADRSSALWRRHAADDDAIDDEQRRRQRYVPDELAHIIIH